jgi:hypothetical protein
MKVGTDVMPPIFSQKLDYNCDEMYTYDGNILYKVEIIFHKVSFIIDTRFPPLLETLYASRVKLFDEVPVFFMHAVSNIVAVRKTASLECILKGDKKMKVWRC